MSVKRVFALYSNIMFANTVFPCLFRHVQACSAGPARGAARRVPAELRHVPEFRVPGPQGATDDTALRAPPEEGENARMGEYNAGAKIYCEIFSLTQFTLSTG